MIFTAAAKLAAFNVSAALLPGPGGELALPGPPGKPSVRCAQSLRPTLVQTLAMSAADANELSYEVPLGEEAVLHGPHTALSTSGDTLLRYVPESDTLRVFSLRAHLKREIPNFSQMLRGPGPHRIDQILASSAEWVYVITDEGNATNVRLVWQGMDQIHDAASLPASIPALRAVSGSGALFRFSAGGDAFTPVRLEPRDDVTPLRFEPALPSSFWPSLSAGHAEVNLVMDPAERPPQWAGFYSASDGTLYRVDLKSGRAVSASLEMPPNFALARSAGADLRYFLGPAGNERRYFEIGLSPDGPLRRGTLKFASRAGVYPLLRRSLARHFTFLPDQAGVVVSLYRAGAGAVLLSANGQIKNAALLAPSEPNVGVDEIRVTPKMILYTTFAAPPGGGAKRWAYRARSLE